MASSVPQKKVYHLPLQLDHNHPRARSLNLSPALHELRFTALERVLLAKLVVNPIITSICVTHFNPTVTAEAQIVCELSLIRTLGEGLF